MRVAYPLASEKRSDRTADARPRMRRDRLTWSSYWLLGYFAFLQAVLGPLMPFLRSDLHLSYAVASLHFSAFALGSASMGLLGDRVIGRFGRRRALWTGAGGMAVGAVLLIAAPWAAGTILASFAMGFLGALVLVTVQAALADSHPTMRGIALTEANVIASICAILSTLAVGGITAIGLNWRLALMLPVGFVALLAVLYAPVRYGAPRMAHTPDVRSHEPLPRWFWVIWLVVLLETGVEWCMGYWGANFLVAGGFSNSTAATCMSLFFLAMVIGRFAGSRLLRSVSGPLLLGSALAIGLCGLPLFWLANIASLRLVGLFLTGLGLANVYPLCVGLGASLVPGRADSVSARISLAGGSAVLIAPGLLGALADSIDIERAFGLAVPLLAGALVLALLYLSHTRVAPATGQDSPQRPSAGNAGAVVEHARGS